MLDPPLLHTWVSIKLIFQNGEFVDMTLAADGYFVKVHQALVALSSPYLKSIITSAPCQHPIVFLNVSMLL